MKTLRLETRKWQEIVFSSLFSYGYRITPQSSRLNTKLPIAIVVYKCRKALQLVKAVVKHVFCSFRVIPPQQKSIFNLQVYVSISIKPFKFKQDYDIMLIC